MGSSGRVSNNFHSKRECVGGKVKLNNASRDPTSMMGIGIGICDVQYVFFVIAPIEPG